MIEVGILIQDLLLLNTDYNKSFSTWENILKDFFYKILNFEYKKKLQ